MDQQTLALAETLWNYHLMKHQVGKADAILVLCSHDERVAERGAQLFLEGCAPLLIFSGGQGAITKTLWDEPEAERFARIAMSMNVPRESILIEKNSTNTGEKSSSLESWSKSRDSIRRSSSWCRSRTWNGVRLRLSYATGLTKKWSSHRHRCLFVIISPSIRIDRCLSPT